MKLIDRSVVQEQFDLVGADMADLLCRELEKDFLTWTARLCDASDAADESGISAARHALKGLCGNFGAEGLLRLAYQPLSKPDGREALMHCASQTVAAIKAIAAKAG